MPQQSGIQAVPTHLAPPGKSRTFSPAFSSLKAAMGEALTAPNFSKKPPTGPAQCPGWARPRTLRREGKRRLRVGYRLACFARHKTRSFQRCTSVVL